MHKGVPFDGVQLGFCFVTAVSLSLSLSWFSETGFLLVVLAVLELGDLSAPAGIKAFTTTARPASLFFLMVKKARVTGLSLCQQPVVSALTLRSMIHF